MTEIPRYLWSSRKLLCAAAFAKLTQTGTIFAGGLESTKTNSSPKGLSLSVNSTAFLLEFSHVCFSSCLSLVRSGLGCH
ncbi:hypothetical protein E4U15_006449 [Claviceps sp. LM218 group G6]|nr:hypothetical protein E4U15_006449 [Claviceps sp. LM218 group G6]